MTNEADRIIWNKVLLSKHGEVGGGSIGKIEDFIHGLTPDQGEVRVPKNLVTEWSAGWYRSLLNLPKDGSRACFRNKCVHAHEMDDHYLVHIDRVDPQKDPIGHLIADAPQVIVAGTVCVCAYLIFSALQKDGGQAKKKKAQ